MDPVTAGMAGGAASAFGGYMNYKGQQEANQANRDIARENNEFMERMSNTAHQREANDLAKAGLNRILSATKGPGASTPSPASATMQNTRAGDMLKDSVNTGFAAANLESDLAIKDAAVAKTLAETAQALTVYPYQATSAKEASIKAYWDRTSASSDAQSAFYKSGQESERLSQEKLRTQRERADTPRAVEKSAIDRDFQKAEKVINTIRDGAGAAAASAAALSRRGRPGMTFEPISIKPGTRAETRALEKSGSKGLPVKK